MTDIQRIPTPYSYSSAVVAGNLVFLGLHRGFGENFADQLEGTFAGIQGTLAKLDLSLDNLVKINVWLKDIRDLPTMEKLFLKHFEKDHFPARMTATTEFIDADCLLMIDGVAYCEVPKATGNESDEFTQQVDNFIQEFRPALDKLA